MIKYSQKDIERFYSKINIITEGPYIGCWDTNYAHNKKDYTLIGVNNSMILCHRFMYQIHHPKENIKNIDINQSCNHNWCVNPDHLICENLEIIESNGPFPYTMNDINRFYNKIIIENGLNTSCWKSEYTHDKDGYVIFSISNNKIKYQVKGHRFMYQIHHPEEDIQFLDVCHLCDHPWCINPDHLWLGTDKENVADRNNKNRQAKGSRIGKSELIEEDVVNILNDILCNKCNRVSELSKKYRISRNVINGILNKKAWKQITKNYDMIKIKSMIDSRTNFKSKFSDSEIIDIRKRIKIGISLSSIARFYNVSTPTISAINNGKTYTTVV